MRFLFWLLFMFLFHFIYLFVGFACFYLGKYFHLVWLSRFGHRLVAYGDAPNFGAHKYWLSRNCLNGDCSRCRLWTCSGRDKE